MAIPHVLHGTDSAPEHDNQCCYNARVKLTAISGFQIPWDPGLVTTVTKTRTLKLVQRPLLALSKVGPFQLHYPLYLRPLSLNNPHDEVDRK